ncbi:hypothetical protein ACFQE8_03120 [Salinirubellus sp. GCM10025818]|uniref:DUF7344 domain-containing protein n=1 Tax=Salinirubellus TaxID=2162630 RepID=UPI0030CD923E
MNSTTTAQPPEEETARPASGPDLRTTDATTETEEEEESLSRDELFHLLQNSRRRAVLRYLRGREGPVRMRDVAEQVAAWEHGTTVARLTSEERQRVYIALYQSHLDTLAEAGVIDYNKPRGVIEPRPLLDRVASFLDPDWSDEGEDEADGGEPEADGSDWDRGYLGVAAAGSLLLFGTALDVSVLGALSNLVTAGIILTAFTLLTLAKLASEWDGSEPVDSE